MSSPASMCSTCAAMHAPLVRRAARKRITYLGRAAAHPVAISLLVKNPAAAQHGQIHFHDIGDYLTREEKLDDPCRFGSIGGIDKAGGWQTITPDEQGDWLKQGTAAYEGLLPIGSKDGSEKCLFSSFSAGVKTNRDAIVLQRVVQRFANRRFNVRLSTSTTPLSTQRAKVTRGVFKWCQKTFG